MTVPNLSRAADAGPIIVLAKVGRLDVLTAGGRNVLVTGTEFRLIFLEQFSNPSTDRFDKFEL